MPFSTKFWGTCSIFSVLFSLSSSEIMIIRDQRLEHGLKACTTVFQLLPLQNLHFLMTKPPTQKLLTIILFLISKLHWWTRTKVTYIPYPVYYLPKYSHGGGVRTVPTRGDLKPLQIPVYLLMKHFRNWRARQPTNHYFEQPRTAATGKNCPPIPGLNQGMTLIPLDGQTTIVFIFHIGEFSQSLSAEIQFFVVQGTIKTVMTENGEYFNVVVIPSDQVPENYQMGNVIFSPKRGKFILLVFSVHKI